MRYENKIGVMEAVKVGKWGGKIKIKGSLKSYMETQILEDPLKIYGSCIMFWCIREKMFHRDILGYQVKTWVPEIALLLWIVWPKTPSDFPLKIVQASAKQLFSLHTLSGRLCCWRHSCLMSLEMWKFSRCPSKSVISLA